MKSISTSEFMIYPSGSTLTDLLGRKTRLGLPMGFLMTRCAEGDQILGSVIAQSAPRLNVMDLKILHTPTRLAAPAISL
jgi:hypothetical protein